MEIKEQVIELELWAEFENECKKAEQIKLEPLNLNPEQKDNINKFFDKFLNEIFPEGSINNTLEKNFAVYIIQNNISLDPIKEKYKSQGWQIGGLLGWIKKVNAGEIKELNIGELVNWCKEYKPELTELFYDFKKIDESKILGKKDLLFPYGHLTIIEPIKKGIGIFGNRYNHLYKMLFYHIVSCSIPESLLIARYNNVECDLREHLFLAYPTGQAKGNVKISLLEINNVYGNKAIPLSSYHEEQLVGKVIVRKKKEQIGTTRGGFPRYETKEEFIQNKGHFIAEWISFDECKGLLTDKTKEDSRGYLLQGMDKYKQNPVYKRLTDNLDNPDEVLQYYPKFRALFMTQPFSYRQENIVMNGFLKRVTTDYIPQETIPDKIYAERINSNSNNQYSKREIIDFMNSIRNEINKLRINETIKPEWTFEQGFNETFLNCFLILRNAGLYNSRKKRNYTNLVAWQLQDRLLRKSCLLTIGKDKTTFVTKENCELAFIDLLEDFIIELDFVENKVYGEIDYGSVWGTIDYREQELLKFLHKRGCLSEETSNVSIAEFQKEIQLVFKILEEMSRKKYYKLIERGLIESCNQKGETPSKVWLIKKPDEDSYSIEGVNPREAYFSYCNKYQQSGKGGKSGN